MNVWWWLLVFGGIAVGALVLIGVLGLKLWRKAKVLLADLADLSTVVAGLEQAIAPIQSHAEAAWSPEPVAIGRHRSE